MRRLIAYPFSVTILVPGIEKKITPKNDITKETYGPTEDYKRWSYDNVERAEYQLKEGKRLIPWTRRFSNVLADKKLSEINIHDLPTIMWNNEEYRVLFKDDNSAEIINDFGNHVITLKNTVTIKQVNDQLSGYDIITDEQEYDEPIDIEDDEVEAEEVEDDETEDDSTAELTVESNRILKKLRSIKAELQETLVKAQEYAHIDGFKDDFDANLLDYQHMIESIELSDKKIKEDNLKRELLLNDEDMEYFKDRICPICYKEDIQIIDDSDDKEWKCKCSECGTEFTINTQTGEVFLIDN